MFLSLKAAGEMLNRHTDKLTHFEEFPAQRTAAVSLPSLPTELCIICAQAAFLVGSHVRQLAGNSAHLQVAK